MSDPATKPFIKAARYDEAKQELEISFQTSTYVYSKVPREIGESFANIPVASEMLWAFDAGIEGRYPSRRITA